MLSSERWFFYFLIIVFLGVQIGKLLFATPLPAFGGDAAGKWNLARDVSQGIFDAFNRTEVVSHHFLRWGTWVVPTILIFAFSDDLFFYYLSTALPSTLAAMIFIWIAFRWIGPMAAVVFALIWSLDPQLYTATFELLPTGAALLPLSLIVFLLMRATQQATNVMYLSCALAGLVFWMYGAKETNLFFLPGVLAALIYLKGWRGFLYFSGSFLTLYAAETAVFMILSDTMDIGGRVQALLSSKAPHLNKMKTVQSLISEQTALWDAGIISRWYSVQPYHLPIYLGALPLFFYGALRHLRRTDPKPGLQVLCLVALSFVLLTSFFIVSLSPVRLGQPIRARYLAILLPLCYLVLLFFLAQLRRKNIIKSLCILASLAVLGGGGLHLARPDMFNKVVSRLHHDLFYAQARDMSFWRTYYSTVGQTDATLLCAHHRRGPIASDLLFVPVSDRSARFNAILSAPIRKQGSIYMRGQGQDCTTDAFIARHYLQ